MSGLCDFYLARLEHNSITVITKIVPFSLVIEKNCKKKNVNIIQLYIALTRN